MKIFNIEPKPVKINRGGRASRPFHINGEHVYDLDMNSVMIEGEESDKEMSKLLEAVSNHIGEEVTKEQFLKSLQTRKLIIGD